MRPSDRSAFVLGWVRGEAERAADEIEAAVKHLDAKQLRACAKEIAARLRGAEERGGQRFDALVEEEAA